MNLSTNIIYLYDYYPIAADFALILPHKQGAIIRLACMYIILHLCAMRLSSYNLML